MNRRISNVEVKEGSSRENREKKGGGRKSREALGATIRLV